MPDAKHNRQRGDTRERLLAAALHAFGHRDYDAVSTREIVDAADANIAAISYHFGGKQQLYLATAEFLVASIRAATGPTLESIRTRAGHAEAGECRRLLTELIRLMTSDIVLGRHSADAVGFIFREQHHPSAAFDTLYDELFEPLHKTFALLFAGATGRHHDSRETTLAVHALIGQITAFRVAQTTILRRLHADRLDSDDVAEIATTITAMTLASVDAASTPGTQS